MRGVSKSFPQGTWLTKTLKMLLERTATFEVIARETGLGIFWLNRVANGRIVDPSVNRIQILHDYLSKDTEKETSRGTKEKD